jgi:hypothetical protein
MSPPATAVMTTTMVQTPRSLRICSKYVQEGGVVSSTKVHPKRQDSLMESDTVIEMVKVIHALNVSTLDGAHIMILCSNFGKTMDILYTAADSH